MAEADKGEKGLSKKELNKLARKAGKKGGEGGSGAAAGAAAIPSNAKVFAVVFCKGAQHSAPPPDLTRIIDLMVNPLSQKTIVKYTINKTANHIPCMYVVSSPDHDEFIGSISGDVNIAKFLIKSFPESNLYGLNKPWQTSQIDQWLDTYNSFNLASPSSGSVLLTSLLSLINNHMSDKTFLVGHNLSLADIAIVTLLRRLGYTNSDENLTNLYRWFNLSSMKIPAPGNIPVSFVPTATNENKVATKTKEAKKGGDNKKAASGTDGAGVEEEGTCPPLEDAEEGKVCTRFPPEPSGYLHIGHCKAVLLNQYYAKRYKGKLIVRFDDTNPSKEKGEYQENIIKDLATLDVKADKVTHSSDYFKELEGYALQLIKTGKGYMDDTDQATMQAERMEHKESKNRNTNVEANVQIFNKLVAGDKDAIAYCLRAKIDMTSVNGTMRDPVLYRFNDTPHHRTGKKHCAYPTYDFACPIIDSVEGVTHALRTTEYNDREEQYHWMQEALGLKKRTKIFTFGKMNFIHTVLSKRKLTWFVEQKLVDGWFDARFPTIQGCVRRGMNVEALKRFILNQGASKRVITMEWDKFWSENKKVLEEASPRYMGVSKVAMVPLTLENVENVITAHTVNVHPSKPEMGTRVMRRNKVVLIDQVDAASYKEGEEVTLLRWGNVKFNSIVKGADGKVTAMTGVYDATATNFSKTKKATWIAQLEDLVPCKLVEFDHLISKAKLGEDEDFKNFVSPNTMTESAALCDPCLRLVKAGDVIQLERKGFFRCDKAYGGSPDKPCVLFTIPDGKVKK